MSIDEILEEIPRLTFEDRCTLWQKLASMENSEEFIPTPEMATAIREGLHSAEHEPLLSIHEARARIEQCAQKSS